MAAQEYNELFKRMCDLCKANKWGDPFNYARGKEIHMANILGHKIADTLSGADAEDEDGECEYKSTVNKNISATYNGISKHKTIEEQEQYLKTEKICKYTNHYFSRFDENGNVVEIYKMHCNKVFEYVWEKIKIQFFKTNRKDPRLGVQIPKKYIIENAIKIYPLVQ